MNDNSRKTKRLFNRRNFLGATAITSMAVALLGNSTSARTAFSSTHKGKSGMKITDVRVLQMAASPANRKGYNWTFV